jgi:hypothetical protein
MAASKTPKDALAAATIKWPSTKLERLCGGLLVAVEFLLQLAPLLCLERERRSGARQ